jgi:hypothetical protein
MREFQAHGRTGRRHDQRVADPDRRERLVESGALAVGAGQSVVEVDPVVGYAELAQPVALRGEVLFVGGAAGVADQNPGHDRLMPAVSARRRRSPSGWIVDRAVFHCSMLSHWATLTTW